MGNKISLTVKESGMDETMLQSVLKQFTKYESLIRIRHKILRQNRAGGKTDAAGKYRILQRRKIRGKIRIM